MPIHRCGEGHRGQPRWLQRCAAVPCAEVPARHVLLLAGQLAGRRRAAARRGRTRQGDTGDTRGSRVVPTAPRACTPPCGARAMSTSSPGVTPSSGSPPKQPGSPGWASNCSNPSSPTTTALICLCWPCSATTSAATCPPAPGCSRPSRRWPGRRYPRTAGHPEPGCACRFPGRRTTGSWPGCSPHWTATTRHRNCCAVPRLWSNPRFDLCRRSTTAPTSRRSRRR
jgi:hypothetical protein